MQDFSQNANYADFSIRVLQPTRIYCRENIDFHIQAPTEETFQIELHCVTHGTEQSCWVVWLSQSPDPKLVVTLPLHPQAHQQYQNILVTKQNAHGSHGCLFACWWGDELVSVCVGWRAFIHNCEAVTTQDLILSNVKKQILKSQYVIRVNGHWFERFYIWNLWK